MLAGHQWLCLHAPLNWTLGPTVRWCAWAMAVHREVGISCQRNSGYRPSRVNIMAQGLSTPDPSLSPTHLSIRRGRATTTHYTHHQVSLMVSRNTTLVPFLGLRIGSACEAGLSAGMQRERVPPHRIKIDKKGHSVERMYLWKRCFDGWVNKTVLNPRVAAAAGRANTYTWDFSRR